MPEHVPSNNALGELVIEVFRLNGSFLSEGDRLTSDLGLSSARWQILGALELAKRPLSVSQIARNMGLARQSVQRVANELNEDDLIFFKDNPDHARAKLVVATARGQRAFRDAMKRQAEWTKRVMASSALTEPRVRETTKLLRRLSASLQEIRR